MEKPEPWEEMRYIYPKDIHGNPLQSFFCLLYLNIPGTDTGRNWRQVSESTNYKTDKKPVRMDYLDDIDIAEFKEIPTYKRMCICILRNDHVCKYMGFALTKEETLIKNMALKQYGKIFKDE